MPTYEYKCPAGHVFEKFYPTMKNSRRLKCPTCGKMAGRQISAGAGLVFKGSGFYITDNRSQSYRDKAKQEKSAGASGSKDAGGSSGSGGSKESGSSSGSGGSAGSGKPGGSEGSGRGKSRRGGSGGGGSSSSSS